MSGFGASGFGGNTNTNTSTNNSSGFGFGSPAASAPTGFGGFTPTTTNNSTGFGATSPGFSAASGGFGAPAPTSGFGTPGFGSATPQSSWNGAPPAVTAFGTGSFGATQSFAAAPSGGFGSAVVFGSAPAAGGFGTSTIGSFAVAPAPASGFGMVQNAAATPAPGGVGAPPTTFSIGSAPAPATAGFGSTTFGAPAAPPSGFGAPPTNTTFGTASAPASGFGASNAFASSPAPAAFGSAPSFGGIAPSSSFGTPAPAAISGFGQPTAFGQQPTSFSTGAVPAFGSAAPAPFAQPSFPQTSTPTFGNTNSTNTFGSSAGGGFASSSTPFNSNSMASQPFGSAAASDPFGGGTTNAPAMSFGVSSSVMQTNEVSMQDDGGSGGGFQQVGAFDSSTTFGQSSGFGTSSAFTSTPFGQTTTNDDSMADADPGTRNPSPVPEASMSPMPDHQDASVPAVDKKDEELSRLKARLEEARRRKKKLEEARHKSRTPESSPPPSPKSQRGSTKAPQSSMPKQSNSPKPAPEGSLAARNALRFAAKLNTDTKSKLPSDLQTTSLSTLKDSTENETLDLQNARSLVGLCQFMCPDDELKRRESEGDIQLLEMVHPDIHPSDWNLRNTAVKRFRRSAADYKLNVPEWIRPPDVLERVCGYLEEWVMERDRQGGDPRFTNGGTPTSLEVYLFIWDRTRMIRKDFILQNFVGTGGNCDARAVRCHERIARWHTMCEHQLSHIEDFVRMQSQQNIAELGQAMKTLNQFYDDSLGRSTVDVPDENGKETRTDLMGYNHGCESNVVQGKPPVDFNGKPLRNDENTVDLRFIGATNSPSRGTAEPEMRALYILLTLENDGGMEVLSYAANLSRERPDVYNSVPVQLAMEIFKAKHELNYARFFSILRDPNTPYLFACLMFKHVEEMRRVAIRVMYMTYGYKKKESSAIQDHYPLKTLVRLLCFEDMEEARHTCKHYNIAVKKVEMSSSSSSTGKKPVEIIFWKGTKFIFPEDEEKGVVLRCRPRKMVRVIESKLNGASRLAVCRGEASGEGSTLSNVPGAKPSVPPTPEQVEMMRLRKEKLQEQMIALRQMEEKRMLEEEQRRRKEELKRKMEEKKRQAEMARKREEDAKREAIEREKQREIEKAKKEAADKERLRVEESARKQAQEEARRKAAARAEEERRLKAEAVAKRLAEEEEAKRKAEEEERERQRQEEVEHRQIEEARKRKIREEAEASRRMEEERKKQKMIQDQMEIELEKRRRQAEAEAKKKAEEEARVNKARKEITWKRIRHKLSSVLQQKKSEESLKRIDLTFSQAFPSLLQHSVDESVVEDVTSVPEDNPNELSICDFLEALINAEQVNPHAISAMLANLISSMTKCDRTDYFNEKRVLGNTVTLLKLAVLVPELGGIQTESVHHLIHKWISSRLTYNNIQQARSGEFEIRFQAVNGNMGNSSIGSDMALLVIPPFSMDWNRGISHAGSLLSSVDESVRVFALNLDDGSDPEYAHYTQDVLRASCAEEVVHVDGDEIQDFESALYSILSHMISAGNEDLTSVEIMSLSRLCSDALRETVYQLDTTEKNVQELLLECSRTTLSAVGKELDSLHRNFQSSQWSSWPPLEFVDKGVVRNYFGHQGDLPISWIHSVSTEVVSPLIARLSAILEGSFTDVFNAFLSLLPPESLGRYQGMMMNEQYALCLESAFGEICTSISFTDEDTLMYLPRGMAFDISKGCARTLSPRLVKAKKGRPLQLEIPTSFAIEADAASHQSTLCVAKFNTPGGVIIHANNDRTLNESSVKSGSTTPYLVVDDEEQSFIPWTRTAKRSFRDGSGNSSLKKHRRETDAERKSKEYTEKLQAMLQGHDLQHIRIGEHGTLRSLLANAPPICLEDDL